MADDFDAVNIIYDFLNGMEVPRWKGKPSEDQTDTHITIEALGCYSWAHTKRIPINVNIYTKKAPNGMVRRSLQKSLKSEVISKLESSLPPAGMYFMMDEPDTTSIPNKKKGFDCYNILLSININS